MSVADEQIRLRRMNKSHFGGFPIVFDEPVRIATCGSHAGIGTDQRLHAIGGSGRGGSSPRFHGPDGVRDC